MNANQAVASFLWDTCGEDWIAKDFMFGETKIGPGSANSTRYLKAVEEYYDALPNSEKQEIVADSMIGHESDFLKYPLTHIFRYICASWRRKDIDEAVVDYLAALEEGYKLDQDEARKRARGIAI